MKLFILIISLSLLTFFVSCEREARIDSTLTNNNGISSDEIVIGSSLALGGHAGYLGTQTLHGALSYINVINSSGGVFGRQIRLVAYDDKYDPAYCLMNTQDLIVKEKVFALFSYVGTPTTAKILPLVEEAEIPLVGMFTGASILRETSRRNIINVRASYYQETSAAVRYYIDRKKVTKFAVFYQYDAYGFDGLRGTELGLKEYNQIPLETGKYIRGTENIDDGLKRIMNSGAEVVFLIGTYNPCAKFIIQSRKNGYTPYFYCVSFVGANALLENLGTHGEGVMVSQVVPPPELAEIDDKLWGVSEYIKSLKQHYPSDKPNYVSLEGYINAKVLIEGLKRSGKDLSRDGFIQAIESISDFDIGLNSNLNYSKDDHQGLDRVYFTEIKNGRFVLVE